MLRKYVSNSCCCFTAYNGRQRWFIEFTTDSRGQSHFFTRDHAQMKAIEASEPFRTGRIAIDCDVDEAKPKTAPAAEQANTVETPSAPRLVEVKGVVTALSGIQFLKEKGYIGSQLKSKAAIKQKANELGYDFVDMLG